MCGKRFAINNNNNSKKRIKNLNLKRKKFRPVVRKLLSVLKSASQTILNPGIRSRSSTIVLSVYQCNRVTKYISSTKYIRLLTEYQIYLLSELHCITIAF